MKISDYVINTLATEGVTHIFEVCGGAISHLLDSLYGRMDIRTVSQGILKKLATVPAVTNGKVCYVSDNLYRLAPRVIQGIEELAACVR